MPISLQNIFFIDSPWFVAKFAAARSDRADEMRFQKQSYGPFADRAQCALPQNWKADLPLRARRESA
jgi:hypothetical protein